MLSYRKVALKFDNCGIIARGQINQQSVIKTLKLRNWRHDKLFVIYTEDLPQWLDIHPSIDRDGTRTHNRLLYVLCASNLRPVCTGKAKQFTIIIMLVLLLMNLNRYFIDEFEQVFAHWVSVPVLLKSKYWNWI